MTETIQADAAETARAERLLPGDGLVRNFDDVGGYTLINRVVTEARIAYWNVKAPYGAATLSESRIRSCFHKDTTGGAR